MWLLPAVLWKFLFINSAVNLFDVTTDLFLYFDLKANGHVNWAWYTLGWMWTPFFAHSSLFLFKLLRDICLCCYRGDNNNDLTFKTVARNFYNEAVAHAPFVIPFQNVKRAVELYYLNYGTDKFEAKNSSKVKTFPPLNHIHSLTRYIVSKR